MNKLYIRFVFILQQIIAYYYTFLIITATKCKISSYLHTTEIQQIMHAHTAIGRLESLFKFSLQS